MNRNRVGQMFSRSAREAQELFIVVVDDEKRIADTLAVILASKGYAAEPAYDGMSALEACRSRVPDLLISDEVMPRMNGIELGIAVKSEFPECRILLFSGRAATAETLAQTKSRGHHFELLEKPVHPVQLLERVEQLIGAPRSIHRSVGCRSQM
jgi:DNA-binding NtrC family response regulator